MKNIKLTPMTLGAYVSSSAPVLAIIFGILVFGGAIVFYLVPESGRATTVAAVVALLIAFVAYPLQKSIDRNTETLKEKREVIRQFYIALIDFLEAANTGSYDLAREKRAELEKKRMSAKLYATTEEAEALDSSLKSVNDFWYAARKRSYRTERIAAVEDELKKLSSINPRDDKKIEKRKVYKEKLIVERKEFSKLRSEQWKIALTDMRASVVKVRPAFFFEEKSGSERAVGSIGLVESVDQEEQVGDEVSQS